MGARKNKRSAAAICPLIELHTEQRHLDIWPCSWGLLLGWREAHLPASAFPNFVVAVAVYFDRAECSALICHKADSQTERVATEERCRLHFFLLRGSLHHQAHIKAFFNGECIRFFCRSRVFPCIRRRAPLVPCSVAWRLTQHSSRCRKRGIMSRL